MISATIDISTSDEFTRAAPISIGEEIIGAEHLQWMLGPVYVESINQVLDAASSLSALGIPFIRSRAYWPSAKPEDFRCHLMSGLKVLRSAADHFGLYVVSEVVTAEDVEVLYEYSDVLEVAPERSIDIDLLNELGKVDKVVLLNRHPFMSLEQFLVCVQHLQRGGCSRLLLAEHGGTALNAPNGNSFDLSSILALRRSTDCPVFLNCSRFSGGPKYIEEIVISAVAAGAHGILGDLLSAQSYTYSSSALAPTQVRGLLQRSQAVKFTLNAIVQQRSQEPGSSQVA